jgi:23S rRNA (uracil1939-C5)-methyltransferase
MTQGMGVRSAEDPVELEIESLAGGGRGVARDQGLVWLVLGGLPGDRVLALPTHRGRRHVEGIATTVVRPSPLRRKPPCPFQGTCGGCPWMGLPEEAQRDWKHRVVVDALVRLGGFRDAVVEPVRASPLELGYRNKIELTLARGEGGDVVIGFHRATEAALVDVDRCLLQDDAANAVLATVRELFHREDAIADPIVKAGGDLARLMIRRAHDGRTLVGIRSLPGPFPSGPALARLLAERHPEVTGVVRILAQPGRRGGATVETLHGEPWIEETLAGTRFRLPADTFFQVNREAAEILAAVVVECAGDVAGKDVL